MGIGFSDGSKSQILILQYGGGSGFGVQVNNFSAPNTYSSTVPNSTISPVPALIWLKIYNDGTNLNFLYSLDSVNFSNIISVGITSYLANAGNIVLTVSQGGSGKSAYGTILSWAQGKI